MPAPELEAFLRAYRAGALDWTGRRGADASALAELRRAAPALPDLYLEMLAHMDGGEGALATAAPISYLRLWSATQSVASNADYEVQHRLPDYWFVGDNGGSEALAFDLSSTERPLYAIPFIPMDAADRIPVAESLSDLLRRLGKRATG